MPDVVGYRAKMAVIAPSTNTVVEHDYNMLRPPGVTFHMGRAYITEPDIDSDAAFEELLEAISRGSETGMRDVLTCKPDYMIMGMSIETFWGGKKGAEDFIEKQRQGSGLDVTTGALATRKALELFGAERIAFLSPYFPVGNEQVRRFYEESGFQVLGDEGLRAPSATAMAQIDARRLAETLEKLDGPDVDALVQVGTNVSMVRLADAAERWLGKPVIAINAACVWDALRNNDVQDRMDGFGSLLREH
jgi:maleate isomerase